MNTDSAECRRLSYPFPQGHDFKPGDFCWGHETDGGIRYLYMVLPGSIRPDSIRVVRGAALGGTEGNHVWGWDGNEGQPTLTPSLHWPNHWHGWLHAGRLVSC